MKVRRVVAGTGADGRSRVFEDALAPRAAEFESAPGFAATLLWATSAAGAARVGAPEQLIAAERESACLSSRTCPSRR